MKSSSGETCLIGRTKDGLVDWLFVSSQKQKQKQKQNWVGWSWSFQKCVSSSFQQTTLVSFNLLMSSYNAHSNMHLGKNFIFGPTQQSKAN